jgi:hypothetical protein
MKSEAYIPPHCTIETCWADAASALAFGLIKDYIHRGWLKVDVPESPSGLVGVTIRLVLVDPLTGGTNRALLDALKALEPHMLYVAAQKEVASPPALKDAS